MKRKEKKKKKTEVIRRRRDLNSMFARLAGDAKKYETFHQPCLHGDVFLSYFYVCVLAISFFSFIKHDYRRFQPAIAHHRHLPTKRRNAARLCNAKNKK